MECNLCGACCVAPDIAALNKPLGMRCSFLGSDSRCTIYENRPNVCRSYQPDELCSHIASTTLPERTARYLAFFGLTEEAAEVERLGIATMTEARTTEAKNGSRTFPSPADPIAPALFAAAAQDPLRPQRISVRRLPMVP